MYWSILSHKSVRVVTYWSHLSNKSFRVVTYWSHLDKKSVRVVTYWSYLGHKSFRLVNLGHTSATNLWSHLGCKSVRVVTDWSHLGHKSVRGSPGLVTPQPQIFLGSHFSVTSLPHLPRPVIHVQSRCGKNLLINYFSWYLCSLRVPVIHAATCFTSSFYESGTVYLT